MSISRERLASTAGGRLSCNAAPPSNSSSADTLTGAWTSSARSSAPCACGSRRARYWRSPRSPGGARGFLRRGLAFVARDPDSAKALEARMIEAVATSHIVGVPLSERVQRGTIGMAKAGTAGCSQREPCYEYPPPHRARSSAGQGIVAGYTGTSEADISHCSMSALPSLRYAQGAGLQWTPRREFCLQ